MTRNRRLRYLLSLAPAERILALSSLSEAERQELAWHWRLWAREQQVPPAGDWRTWLIMAGRGFGKTRAGAEWVREVATADPTARIILVGASLGEARAVMVEGESGILALSPPRRRPKFEPSLRRLTWPNGAQATIYSAGEPESLRGPQASHAWCDEIAKWDNSGGRAQAAWDNLMLGLRLGENPRLVATTTPRAVPLLRTVLESDGLVLTRGRSEDNADNLPPRFLRDVRRAYGRSALGRQELDGELIEDIAGALWTRGLIEQCREAAAPQDKARVVIGVDPPASANGDACGIVVAALGPDGIGKNQPDVTTYSYSVSFAVALSSRPIVSIGRIWADGRLLRGESGDLKANGTMRLYTGEEDQAVDPLIAEIEGDALSPAYRGLAYVVFEDLDLSEFYNRIPALTFEIIADEAFGLAEIVEEVIDDSDAQVPLDGLSGFSCEGPLGDVLVQLDPIFPIDADASSATMVFARERLQAEPIALPEPAISVDDGDFGGAAGYARQRGARRERPLEILRYYDVDRDYQPGLQRASGRPGPGQPRTVEIAGAMTASTALSLADGMRQKADWSRDQLSWRTCELDPAVAPGSVVTVAAFAGNWRVDGWELRDKGIELSLVRVVPGGTDASSPPVVDPGRINPVPDVPAPPTTLAAFELPPEGTGTANTLRTYAAVSSNGSTWSGAALFSDDGNGSVQSLGPSGRTRSILGFATSALGAASPALLDRERSLTVELLADDMTLANATAAQLASGANRALIGSEIIQFATAEPLGGRIWRLSSLLRGRGGTETAISEHSAGEGFVLLDQRLRLLDSTLVPSGPATQILAAGRGDPDPFSASIGMRGSSLRPLAPVGGKVLPLADGSLSLCWTRRARGAWLWLDGAETPLVEEVERYLVTFGNLATPLASWTVSTNELALAPADVAALQSALPSGSFHVRQLGSFATSEPSFIAAIG